MDGKLHEQLCDKDWSALAACLELLTLAQWQLEAWPAGLRELGKLRYLELRCTDYAPAQPLDLIMVRDIPHVFLFFGVSAELRCTGGAWRSICISNACVHFSYAGSFVQGTERFFLYCIEEQSRPMIEAIKAACIQNHTAWWQWGTDNAETSIDTHMAGISNTRHLVEGQCESCLVTPDEFLAQQ